MPAAHPRNYLRWPVGEAEHKRYCLACGYDLKGLSELRCPECARPFDPDNPQTYASRAGERNRILVLIALYLVPVALNAAVAALFVAARGEYYRGPKAVIEVAALSGCGPLLSVLSLEHIGFPYLPHTVSALFWGGWFALLCVGKLRSLPYSVHGVWIACACAWCLLGAGVVAVAV